MYRFIEELRALKDWPDHVFVPTYAVYEAMTYQTKYRDTRKLLQFIWGGITFATWRMTQGIYRFDETLYSELIHTQNTGDLPVDVLIRLPEWCVYIETPGLTVNFPENPAVPIYGAWARIDLTGSYEPVLAILVDCGDVERSPLPDTLNIPLQSGTIKQGIYKMFAETVPSDYAWEDAEMAATAAYPIVNLLLYLCAGADYAGAPPHNPAPIKTKRGHRLFVPDKAMVWEIGVRMGAALRNAYAAQERAASAGDGRSLRPHIRRAHWHGFRSGPMLDAQGAPIPKEKRRFDLRWLPPIPVNIDGSELPSVIRPIK